MTTTFDLPAGSIRCHVETGTPAPTSDGKRLQGSLEQGGDAVVGSFETELPLASSVALAGLVLREQGMPADELLAVLTSEDAEIVLRHLALHVERMEERLVEQRKRATWADLLLTIAAGRRGQFEGAGVRSSER